MATLTLVAPIPPQTRPALQHRYAEAAAIFVARFPGITGNYLRSQHPGNTVVAGLAEAVDVLRATG